MTTSWDKITAAASQSGWRLHERTGRSLEFVRQVRPGQSVPFVRVWFTSGYGDRVEAAYFGPKRGDNASTTPITGGTPAIVAVLREFDPR